jgi:hypothetical protein
MEKWFDTLALSVIVFTLPNHRKMRNSMMKKVLLVLGLFLGLLVNAWATYFGAVEITSINAPPLKVWEKLADFSLLDWNPEVVKVELIEGVAMKPGAVRVVTLKDGSKYKEKLVEIDPSKMRLVAEVIESTLPMKQLSSTLNVTEKYGTAIVEWNGQFTSDNPQDAQKASQFIQTLYRKGFAHLKTMLEAKP